MQQVKSLHPDIKPTTFKAYLKTFEPDAVVGERSNCEDCPFQRWLVTLLPQRKEDILVKSGVVEVNDTWYRSPAWMRHTVRHIDRNAWTLRDEITASEVLKALEHGLKEAQEAKERRETPNGSA